MEGRIDRVELQTALYDAALEGDVSCLLSILEQDELILDRCNLENSDRFTQSPLHVAAKLGHSEIVEALIERDPTMCLARYRDGRNPLHVAAIRGRLSVLGLLLQAQPQAARELADQGETVLHLCAKYRREDALEYLVDSVDDAELLNSRDSLGNTVLHLAVATRQLKMVKFLLGKKKMEKNATNTNGLTAMDICFECEKNNCTDEGKEIKQSLRLAGALRSRVASIPQKKDRNNWLENRRNALMVVASLIATMAFQVGVNPVGGVWQNGNNQQDASSRTLAPTPNTNYYHFTGSSVMATENPSKYKTMLASNTVALFSSVIVIYMLISGLPYNRLFVFVLTLIMKIAISATAITYVLSVDFLSSKHKPTTSDGIKGSPGAPQQYYSSYDSKSYFSFWTILILIIILLFLAWLCRAAVTLIKKLVHSARERRSWSKGYRQAFCC